MIIPSKNQKNIFLKYYIHWLFLLAILAGVFLAYRGLSNSYFEQDEWHSFGNYNFLLSLKGLEFAGNMLVSDFPYHFAPLSLMFKMNLYRVFELNAAPYFIVSIFLHFLVSSSVYLLIFKLTKRKLAAFIGSLFFAVNSSHYQAITWIGTFEGVEFSVLFGSLALLAYLFYLEKNRVKYLLLTCGLSLIGLLFKETALTFVLLLGMFALFSGSIRAKIVNTISIALVLIAYVLLRFTYLLFGVQALPISGIQAKDDLFLSLLYNLITSSVKIFAQVFFPNEYLVYISNITSSPFNIYQHLARGPWIIENGFRYDLLMFPLGLLVAVSLWLICRKVKERRIIFLGLGIILFAIIPLLALNRYLTYLDSRYLYPATVGFSLIVGSISGRIIYLNKKIIIGVGLIGLIVVLSSHLFSLNETVNKLVKIGRTRKTITSHIVNLYPRLPSRTIFYTKSNSPFYGSSENEKIMPFQSGFGQLLLIIYNPTESFATEFFKNEFLWNIADRGYKEFEGRGFGYFYDFDSMANLIKEQKLPPDSLIAFDYDANTNALDDTTQQNRSRLESFLADKKEIDSTNWNITTINNIKNIDLTFDGKINTFWDSQITIASSPELIIDLGSTYPVKAVQIDSRSSKDQNRNGYQILLSEDKQNWKEVFYESLYPPKDGEVNIYFSPASARFVKIKQIGDHQYASWIINEVKVYQSIKDAETKN